ncbi:hypothetical protein GIB67_018939 [Kingdonia uniflora]|uniref:Uncharacterized protein n=1 Tax=Kingdonia uniflora TaxID=39325 RepID=A0A7J7L2M7_9MAGN|nr:hypothetical protein GIB67_018939 [Kingdonia uniflora]
MMSHHRIAFSWENKLGVMNTNQEDLVDIDKPLPLPPPPFLRDSPKVVGHRKFRDLLIARPPSRNSSRKAVTKGDQDDPFLAAYKECTKSVKLSKDRKKGSAPWKERNGSIFSCKHSCGIKEDNLVRVSHGPRYPK